MRARATRLAFDPAAPSIPPPKTAAATGPFRLAAARRRTRCSFASPAPLAAGPVESTGNGSWEGKGVTAMQLGTHFSSTHVAEPAQVQLIVTSQSSVNSPHSIPSDSHVFVCGRAAGAGSAGASFAH